MFGLLELVVVGFAGYVCLVCLIVLFDFNYICVVGGLIWSYFAYLRLICFFAVWWWVVYLLVADLDLCSDGFCLCICCELIVVLRIGLRVCGHCYGIVLCLNW